MSRSSASAGGRCASVSRLGVRKGGPLDDWQRRNFDTLWWALVPCESGTPT
jgi:hypothetical protein